MRWPVLLLGLLAPSALPAQPARDEVRTLASAGAWSAFGGRLADGRATCGIDTHFPATGGSVLFHYADRDDFLLVRVVKPSWTIPPNTDIPIRLEIDGAESWTARALGEGRELSWRITGPVLDEWEPAFRRGMQMRLVFPQGSEPAWVASLSGTNAIMNAFAGCLAAIQSSSAATQPFGRNAAPSPRAPSQPFGAPAGSGGRTQGAGPPKD